MDLHYEKNLNIPVIAEADVLVIGGGPGGLGASVMAARQGVSVVLAERYGCPGGMASFGEITPFMMNHLHGITLDKPVYVDWCRRMWEYQTAAQREEVFNEEVTINTKIAKDVAMLAAEDLMLEAGVKIFYHHTLVDVIRDGNRIVAAVFSTKSGLCAIKAKQFVDATGDGDLAALAGCEFEFGNEDGFCQPMTLCFKLGGVDRARMPDGKEINRLYDEAKAAGRIVCPRENVLWFLTVDDDVIHFNTTRIIRKSGVNGQDLSEAEIEGRRQLRDYLKFLRDSVPGFENAYIYSIAHHIGIRETRRVLGEHYQTADDFMTRKKYDDAVVKVRYSIDIHNPSGTGTVLHFMDADDWYEISFRTLIVKGMANLLMGCRAISIDHALHSSARVMPPVCSIGQAAGMGAAMAVKENCTLQELNSVGVREALREQGAEL